MEDSVVTAAVGAAREPDAPSGAEFHVLGGVRVAVAGAELSLPPQARLVIALLLRRPGRPVSLDELTGGDEGDPDKAIAAARVAISRLRRLLDGIATVSTTPFGYALDLDPKRVDHVEFDRLIRAARSTEWPAAAKDLVERALELWQAPPFGHLCDHAALGAEVRALEELNRSAVDLWCDLVLQTGRHVDELVGLERAVRDEPLREERWRALMIAHYRAGNQAEAIRTYDRARTLLLDELGLDPGPILQETLARALDQDPLLDWRPQRRTARPSTMVPLTPLASASVVLGRTGEIHDVLSMLERRRVVTIVGLGGIGKSALPGEIARTGTRPAWVAALADVHDPSAVPSSVAAAIGLSPRLVSADLTHEIATHLQSVGGLLVLDNCEHLAAAVADLAGALAVAAPDARVLATSRVELDVTGGASFRLEGLDTGTRDRPGPAALIVADHASIGRSAIPDRWSEIAGICGRAEGIPLALQLFAAASVDGAGSVVDADSVAGAVLSAVDALPVESRRLVMQLGSMPSGTSVEFLAEVLERPPSEIRAELGFAVRASLVVQRGGASTTRIRLIEPARDVLSPLTDPEELLVPLQRALLRLAAAVRPSLIDRLHRQPAELLDGEHDAVAWMLARLAPSARLELAVALAPLWRAGGRTRFGVDELEELEPFVPAAPRELQARYWIGRAQIAPSVLNRVPFMGALGDAVEIASELGLEDVELRARSELVLALGWTGDLEGALAQLREVDARVPTGSEWAAQSLASLHAMGRALVGDRIAAADDMIEVCIGFRGAGDVDEAMWAASVAAGFARAGGDLGRARRAVELVADLQPDRFTQFSHAALTYERALISVADGAAVAGPRLWEALGLLTEHADRRLISACRADLGIWRLDHGDEAGLDDLVEAARTLLAVEPARATDALERLVVELDRRGQLDHADALRSVLDAVDGPDADPSGSPEFASRLIERADHVLARLRD